MRDDLPLLLLSTGTVSAVADVGFLFMNAGHGTSEHVERIIEGSKIYLSPNEVFNFSSGKRQGANHIGKSLTRPRKGLSLLE